jgi:hypothetical protein
MCSTGHNTKRLGALQGHQKGKPGNLEVLDNRADQSEGEQPAAV